MKSRVFGSWSASCSDKPISRVSYGGFLKWGGSPKSSNLYTYSFHYFSLTIKLLGYPHDYGNLPILSFGWWFGTFFIFHNIWDNHSHWLSYFSRWLKHVETTNQIIINHHELYNNHIYPYINHYKQYINHIFIVFQFSHWSRLGGVLLLLQSYGEPDPGAAFGPGPFHRWSRTVWNKNRL